MRVDDEDSERVQACVFGEGAVNLTTTFPFVNPIQTSGGLVVARLADDGSQFTFSSSFGGSDLEVAGEIAVAPDGSLVIAGLTASNDLSIASAFQSSYGGSGDGFVSRIVPGDSFTSSALAFSSYLGGSSTDGCTAVALDGTDNIYLTGTTESPGAFPLAGTPLLSQHQGGTDVFFAKIRGTNLQYSTYLGGAGDEEPFGLAVDGGEYFITGWCAEHQVSPTFQVVLDNLITGNLPGIQTANKGGANQAFATLPAPDRPSLDLFPKGIDAFVLKLDSP